MAHPKFVAQEDLFVSKVFDFNEQVIKLPPETDNVGLNPLTQKQADWTEKFVLEELGEFKEAFEKQDMVGMVDAIWDLCYGALGTLKKMGLTRAQTIACFDAIHDANMTKARGDKGRGSDEDATKPADFVPPEAKIGYVLFGSEESAL